MKSVKRVVCLSFTVPDDEDWQKSLGRVHPLATELMEDYPDVSVSSSFVTVESQPEPCEISTDVPPENWQDYYGLWCSKHSKKADHVGTDGDTPICEVYAKQGGCNCCPENYRK